MTDLLIRSIERLFLFLLVVTLIAGAWLFIAAIAVALSSWSHT